MMTKKISTQNPDSVGKTKVLLEVTELSPDRTPYKQYNGHFKPFNLFCEIEIPNEFIIENNPPMNVAIDYDRINMVPGKIIVSVDGVAYVGGLIATSWEKVHDTWLGEQK